MKKKITIIVAMFLIFTVGCAGWQVQQLTTKQQAAIWFNVYSSAYDDTMTMANNPMITPAQKELVVKKKAVLTQVWPLLKVYSAIVDSGGTPDAATTNQIINLINQLVGGAT